MAWERGYSSMDTKRKVLRWTALLTGTIFFNRKLEAGSSTVTSNRPPSAGPQTRRVSQRTLSLLAEGVVPCI